MKTGLYDKNEKEIEAGNLIKIPTELNMDLHGQYVYYEVEMKGIIPMLMYVKSEKETRIPKHYMFKLLTDYFDVEQIMYGKAKNREIEIVLR